MSSSETGIIDTEIGPLRLAVHDGALIRIDFLDGPAETADATSPAGAARAARATGAAEAAHGRVLTDAAIQLTDYLAGRRTAFDLPLAPDGTPFQLAVWEALPHIPYGGTLAYAELASLIGRPRAVRAVGAANGANPLPIVLPCHRVVGSDGGLTGYGGGLDVKRRLLALEAATHGWPAPWERAGA